MRRKEDGDAAAFEVHYRTETGEGRSRCSICGDRKIVKDVPLSRLLVDLLKHSRTCGASLVALGGYVTVNGERRAAVMMNGRRTMVLERPAQGAVRAFEYGR